MDIPHQHTYVSKGKHTLNGDCEVKFFERNGREYENHYERSTVTLKVTSHQFKTTTGILSKRGFDVLLPHNVRMPAERSHYTDNRMGCVIWSPEVGKCDATTGYTNEWVELFKGDTDVHLKRDTTKATKYHNALVTVYNEDKHLKALPVTFGYSIRYQTQICGVKAFQTKLELSVKCFLILSVKILYFSVGKMRVTQNYVQNLEWAVLYCPWQGFHRPSRRA